MDVFDAIRNRRSIKPEKMKPEPIDRATLDRLFEAANWAPTHGMTEPWRFVIFQGDARRELADAVISTMAEDGQPALAADDPRRQSVYDKMLRPPVCAAIVCAPSTSPKIVLHEEIASVAMAVQNIQVAGRSIGIATYWTSGKKAFHPKMAEFLGIAPPAQCLGLLYVGYPEGEWPEGRRQPAAAKLTWRGTETARTKLSSAPDSR